MYQFMSTYASDCKIIKKYYQGEILPQQPPAYMCLNNA